jgi:hypothetical protein
MNLTGVNSQPPRKLGKIWCEWKRRWTILEKLLIPDKLRTRNPMAHSYEYKYSFPTYLMGIVVQNIYKTDVRETNMWKIGEVAIALQNKSFYIKMT